MNKLHVLASALKLGLLPLPPGLSYREKAQLKKLGVQLEVPPKPDNRPWRLK
jgi:hypothetical protein